MTRPLIGGVNGSFFNLNFASPTIDAKSSVSYTVAYLYGTSLADLRTVCRCSGGSATTSPRRSNTVSAQIPDRFALQQNYPNPFNPSTVISCQLPVAGHVKLVVYDLLGREVAVLADGQFAAGEYSFRFDGSRLCQRRVLLPAHGRILRDDDEDGTAEVIVHGA